MRRKAELVKECLALDSAFTREELEARSTTELMDTLRDRYCIDRDILPQIEPMLCRDAKMLLDYSRKKPWTSKELCDMFWSNDHWIAEQKLDGCRMKMHITSKGIRLDSRRLSDVDYAFKERTQNFPQFSKIGVGRLPAWMVGLVLDGEIFMPVKRLNTGVVITNGYLNSTVAIANSSPEISIGLQKKYRWAKYYVFDICGEGLYTQRRNTVEKVVEAFENMSSFGFGKHLVKMPLWSKDDKSGFYERMIEGGFEGIVLKNIYGRYEYGKRPDCQYKLKKFSTADVFISNFLPGKHGFEGLVGALCVSVMRDKKPVEVGAVSTMTLDFRRKITAPDGSLVDSCYGKVLECRYQELTKTNRMRHATIFRWRPDKSMYDCKGEDIFG